MPFRLPSSQDIIFEEVSQFLRRVGVVISRGVALASGLPSRRGTGFPSLFKQSELEAAFHAESQPKESECSL